VAIKINSNDKDLKILLKITKLKFIYQIPYIIYHPSINRPTWSTWVLPCDDSGFDIEGIIIKGIFRASPVTGKISLRMIRVQ